MIKSISIFAALLALVFADAVLAAGAIATSVAGTVTVQAGTAAPRPLRQGDAVSQGDTIVTAAASSAVLRFDDGEITALTANSRMQVTAYQYNASNNSGNVFLSLLSGGMRAITGLIGRGSPNNVAYRAATATIGIRGTTVDVVTDGNTIAVSVSDGEITFSFNGATITVPAGQGAFAANGTITPGSAQEIFQKVQQQNPAMGAALNSIGALTAAINISTGAAGDTTSATVGSTTVNATTGSGSGGGGTASPH